MKYDNLVKSGHSRLSGVVLLHNTLKKKDCGQAGMMRKLYYSTFYETIKNNSRVIAVLLILASTVLVPFTATAAFVSGSTGADGEFAPTSNTMLQIPENGIFNFTTVNIPSGVTVTFIKNSQNTPVTILVIGDVTIAGTINLNGGNGNYIIPGASGPGGFEGGQGAAVNKTGNRGEGPGGGIGGAPRAAASGAGCGGGGAFAVNGGGGHNYYSEAPGGAGGTAYGNERVLPSIGGSGGAGGGGTNTYTGGAGGGGGGAVVIASSGTINVTGTITANGGKGANGEQVTGCGNTYNGGAGGGGSGGSIRLISNTISGNGTINAIGGGGGTGYGNCSLNYGGSGSSGRIRLEASSITRTAATNPPMSLGYPYAVIPTNMPTLTIASAGGVDSPTVPKGSFGSPDVMLPFNTQNPITVVVTGAYIPAGTTVTLKASPAVGTATSATGTLSGTETSSSASIQITISKAYPSVLTATVTFQLASLGIGPIYAQGELVEKVRVEAAMGGGSTMTYITASGKEIPANQLKS